VLLSEASLVVLPQGICQFIGEFFRRSVNGASSSPLLQNLRGNGLDQVGFPQVRIAAQKERIVGTPGGTDNGYASGMGHLIAEAKDKIFKGVF
jgi:hypothetical protein